MNYNEADARIGLIERQIDELQRVPSRLKRVTSVEAKPSPSPPEQKNESNGPSHQRDRLVAA